ncbi:MAG: GIY-YIG nuclease family protein [Thermomicrobiales bacterium]|nr:GIY-YIG nuclease family protein [Thermomicrobiales bacterium]
MSPRQPRSYWVYIVTNVRGRSGTLYIGVTNDLQRRIREHAQLRADTFTGRYGISRLVYYEEFPYVNDAISREKQLKHWLRSRKIELIESENPDWEDLSAGWFEE